MKRLFYVTSNLDDAESISDEVHNMGIDDHHFFVLSRDDNGIKTHHLHGAKSLENTDILAAKKRANLFAVFALFVAAGITSYILGFEYLNAVYIALASSIVFFIIKFIITLAGSSFDEYFKNLINEHLDSGEVIIIIDVKKNQAENVQLQLEKHPAANFIADSSNFASPIPTN